MYQKCEGVLNDSFLGDFQINLKQYYEMDYQFLN